MGDGALFAEFTKALCSEEWKVGGGVMIPTGGPSENAHKLAEFEAPTENVDAFGNVRLACRTCVLLQARWFLQLRWCSG